jgi:hypothetical protein
MSDFERDRLMAAERAAFATYDNMQKNFARHPDIVEAARVLWAEAANAVVEYRYMSQGVAVLRPRRRA